MMKLLNFFSVLVVLMANAWATPVPSGTAVFPAPLTAAYHAPLIAATAPITRVAYSAPLLAAPLAAYTNAHLDAATSSSRVDIKENYNSAIVPVAYAATRVSAVPAVRAVPAAPVVSVPSAPVVPAVPAHSASLKYTATPIFI